MKLYFAYGANLNLENMAWRCSDAVAVQPFYLRDWRLAFSGVATVQPCQGDRVPGALWAISDQDEAALDRFEAWPSLYRKETVRQDGLQFMMYVMNCDQPRPPGDHYLSSIADGYLDWRLPTVALDRAVQNTVDQYLIGLDVAHQQIMV